MTSEDKQFLMEFYSLISEVCLELSYNEPDKESLRVLSDRLFEKFKELNRIVPKENNNEQL